MSKGRGRKRVLFIGGTQVGKSTQITKVIEADNEPVIIHDNNNQVKYWKYPEISLEQFANQKSGKYRILTDDHEAFWYTARNGEFKGGKIISEDASVYLTPQKNMKIYPNLISLRHPDYDCDIILVAHAVQDMPEYIIRQANEIVLFKTGDNWKTIRDRFPDHVRAEAERIFNEVNNSEDPHIFRRIIIRSTNYN